MKGPRFLQAGICLLLLVGTAIFLPIEIGELLRYEKLPGQYEAYLLRYELDGFAPHPERHKHAVVQITFSDGRRVEFRSARNGRYEWLTPGQKLDILVKHPDGARNPEYEVNSILHLYSDLLIILCVGAISLIGFLTWPKDPAHYSAEKSPSGSN